MNREEIRTIIEDTLKGEKWYYLTEKGYVEYKLGEAIDESRIYVKADWVFEQMESLKEHFNFYGDDLKILANGVAYGMEMLKEELLKRLDSESYCKVKDICKELGIK